MNINLFRKKRMKVPRSFCYNSFYQCVQLNVVKCNTCVTKTRLMHKLICIRMIVCYLHNVAQVKIFIYEEKSQQFNRLTIFSLFFYVSKYIHNETRRVVLKTVVMHNATECLPNCSVDSVNKCINCCFRYITNFLYQKNIISLHDLQPENKYR